MFQTRRAAMGNRESVNAAVVKELERYNPIVIQSQEAGRRELWYLYIDYPVRLVSRSKDKAISFSGNLIVRQPAEERDTVEYRGFSTAGKGRQFRLKLKRYSNCHFQGEMQEGQHPFGLFECAKVVVYTDGR
jgi:hypothetical protein